VTTLNQTIDAALYKGLSFKLDRGIVRIIKKESQRRPLEMVIFQKN